MTTQTIKVEGLPEGWKAVAYRCAIKGEKILMTKEVITATHNHESSSIIVEKIQPRRIVLDENVLNDVCWVFIENYGNIMKEQYTNNLFNNIKPLLRIVIESYLGKIQVKETDIPLNNEEPNVKMGVSHGDGERLELSVDECKELVKYGGFAKDKILEFIKDK